MQPIALTDAELDTVMRAAEPLHPRDRAAFAAAVAQVLAGQGVIGDGIVARTCRELQRRFMTSPPEVHATSRAGRAAAATACAQAPSRCP